MDPPIELCLDADYAYGILKIKMASLQSAAAPRRGRPARFSRDQIVEAVTEMVLADPSSPLTVARAADAVGAKPMSLYRHFADRDDLVAAVARHLFAGVRPAVGTGTPWQDEVRAWMTAMYRQARRVPQIVQLLATGESAEWLDDSAHLAGIFERAGVADDHVIAQAVYVVATTTMGHAMLHAAGRDHARGERLQTALTRLDGDDAARMARLIPQFDSVREDGFGLVVELAVAGLEHLLAMRPR